MATKECEFDPDHLYHDHHEADAVRAEIEKLERDRDMLLRLIYWLWITLDSGPQAAED